MVGCPTSDDSSLCKRREHMADIIPKEHLLLIRMINIHPSTEVIQQWLEE
jgi:hypothetical protein